MAIKKNPTQPEYDGNNGNPDEAEIVTSNDTAPQNNEAEMTQERPSVQSGAPDAMEVGRETVSRNTTAEPAPAEKEKAGGLKTITDRQAFLTKEIYKTVGNIPKDKVFDLYDAARKHLNEDVENVKENPEQFSYMRDRSLATMLACHAAMHNSKDTEIKESAKMFTGANQMSFGITQADCEKLCDDLANENVDWSAIEENEKAAENKEKNTVTPEQTAFLKEEAKALEGKSTKEIMTYYQNARKEVREAMTQKRVEDTPENQAAYDRSLAKFMAGESSLRQSPDVDAQKMVLAHRNMYGNEFGINYQDVDRALHAVNTPTPEMPEPETPNVQAQEVNHYPEEPEQEKKEPEKVQVKQPEKKEEKKDKTAPEKAEKPTPEQLKKRMEYIGNMLNTMTGGKIDKGAIDEFGKKLDTFSKLSPELRSSVFSEMFRDHTKAQMQTALSQDAATRKSGNVAAPIPDVAKTVLEYAQAQFDYFTASNPSLEGIKAPLFGGMQPSEIQNMQNAALLSLPVNLQNKTEKGAIAANFNSQKQMQDKTIKSDFRSFVGQMNKDQGTKFSSAGIENYLAARWKEGAGKDLDSQRTLFQNELKEFQTKAYENMLSKANNKTDLFEQLATFDKFCSHLETMCKANGWMDKDAPHAFAGDLSPSAIKEMQTKAVDKMPKNTQENANEIIDDLSGEKEKRRQAENAQKQKEAIKKEKNKGAKKALQEKAALDKKNSKDVQAQKEENFLSSVQKHIDAVPKDPKNYDNPEVRNALALAKSIETLSGNHSRAWHVFHPFKSRMYSKAVNNIMNGLEAKGYKKEIVNHLLQNPQKPENDPVTEEHNMQKEDIENMMSVNDKLSRERGEFSQELDKANKGEQITVPEADNRKEIVNPQEKSQFIVPEKNVSLTVGGPTQAQPQQNQAQPATITN